MTFSERMKANKKRMDEFYTSNPERVQKILAQTEAKREAKRLKRINKV